MRRAARIDDNQREIAAAFRACGCRVLSLAAVGKGCPDLLVQKGTRLMLVEVKDGAKCACRRKLTADQVRFHAEWQSILVVSSVDDVVDAVNIFL